MQCNAIMGLNQSLESGLMKGLTKIWFCMTYTQNEWSPTERLTIDFKEIFGLVPKYVSLFWLVKINMQLNI